MSENNSTAKKAGFVQRVKRFFLDIKGESKKIVWPSKETTKTYLAIVCVVVAISAVFVSLLDLGAGRLVALFGQFL